ncbi:MAG: hypothetical protein AAFU77_11890, partial [Myxococcota bacterium]
MPRTLLPCFVLLLAAPSCFVELGRRCGFGTEVQNGECVTQSACGPGTRFDPDRGECVQRSSGSVTCGPGTRVNAEGDCEVDPEFCVPPSQYDTGLRVCVPPDQIVCGEGTEPFGSLCVPSCPGEFEIQNATLDGCDPAYRVQLVHASPDPSLATLDVYANGRRADDLPFGQATGVFKVAMNTRVDIAPSDSSGTNDSLALAVPPAQPSRVLLVVRGVLGTGFDTSVNDTTLTLDSVEGYLEEPSSAGALELLLYHAVPDAPAVSVGLQESPDVAAPSPLFSNVGYGGFSGYEAGALGTNPLDV